MRMSKIHIRALVPHGTALAGLSLLGIGAVGSCASSPQIDPSGSTPAAKIHHEPKPEHSGTESPASSGDETLNASTAKEADTSPPPADAGLAAEPENPDVLELRNQTASLNEEIRALYRRLHIELPPIERSALIVELLRDARVSHQALGFELADRELSASATLSDEVGQASRILILSAVPEIRARSARLITRLSPPDAMILLTDALQTERVASAAEPMLLGVARWPNADAIQSVLEWCKREDAPKFAMFSAALSMEREGMWENGTHYPILTASLREASPRELREDGMKLLALLGTSEDLRRLVELMLSEDPGVVRWAAAALVETPRAVETLEQAAIQNEVFYLPAAESLIQHRTTPDGLRRLGELPQTDPNLRREMILRMGSNIDRDQLGEAVKLARLEPELMIDVLSTLVRNETPHSARSARSVITLAELQLQAGRPNRVIEALLSLEDAPLDSSDQTKRDQIRVRALLQLSRFEEAATLSLDFDTWVSGIDLVSDTQLRGRIAAEFLSRAESALSDEQKHTLNAFIPAQETQSAPSEEVKDPEEE
jgi:hypothetical protein